MRRQSGNTYERPNRSGHRPHGHHMASRMTRPPDCRSMLEVLDPLGMEGTNSGARPPAPGRGTPYVDVTTAAPVTVTRVESATGWWEFARRAPDHLLTGLVAGRCGYQEQCDRPLRRHLTAGSLVPLILSFGDRLDLLDKPGAEGAGRSYGSLVAGLHPGPAITEVSGTQLAVQVYLSPLGAYQILGVPGAALAHRVDDLADVAPDLAGSLPDRLASLRTWSQRLALVDEVLVDMSRRGPEPDPLVGWMWLRLQASGGRARITDLVDQSGWSHRHVTARFHTQVGVTPKAAARLIRFERAARSLTSRKPLAEVAARHGYADQSHLTREFVRLAGHTPAAYAAAPGRRPPPQARPGQIRSRQERSSAPTVLA